MAEEGQDDIQVSGLADQEEQEDGQDGEGEIPGYVLSSGAWGQVSGWLCPVRRGVWDLPVQGHGDVLAMGEIVQEKSRIRRGDGQCQQGMVQLDSGEQRRSRRQVQSWGDGQEKVVEKICKKAHIYVFVSQHICGGEP